MKYFFLLPVFSFFSFICSSQIVTDETNPGGGIPVNKQVGTLPGTFSITPSGCAQYIIALDLPPGRVDLKPEIAFVYNSGLKAGNILGQGWSISGFSSICRSNPSNYYNGFNDNIDFENDELILDGQHLIKIGNKEYRTELDVFSKIVEIDESNGGSHFIVYTKSGLIIEYGNSSDSKQYYQGTFSTNPPLAWHINNVTDRMGNRIDYTYFQDPQFGEVHPESILYTGSNKRSLGSTKISFIYGYSSIGDKIQHISFFEKGNPPQPYVNSNTMLLSKILISNDNGTTKLREYAVTYYEQKGVCKEFFVKEISLISYENGIATSLKPTKFGWDFYKPLYNDSGLFETHRISLNSTYETMGLDVNGDNYDEIAVYMNEEEEYFPWESNKVIVLHGLSTGVIELEVIGFFKGFYAIDFDNNGDDELLMVDDEGIKIYDVVNGAFVSIFNNPLVGKIYIGDITGDNINDIFVKQPTQLRILVGNRSNGTFGYDESLHSLPLSTGLSIRTIADFNGDGKVEVFCKGSTNNYLSLWKFDVASGFTMINEEFYLEDLPDNLYYNDFNGDGKTDIGYIKTVNNTQYRYTHFSYGDYFTTARQSIYTGNNEPSVVADINNDGRTDLLDITLLNGNAVFKCYFTTPDGVSNELQETSTTVNYFWHQLDINTANINANGTLGFIFTLMTNKEEGSPHHVYHDLTILAFEDMGHGNNVIDTITNGFGVETHINYSNFGTSGPLYSDFPITKSRNKGNVVSESYILGDNNEKWNWEKYIYKTPVSHMQGKGFLGFLEVQTTSMQNNTLDIINFAIKEKSGKYYFLYPETNYLWSLNNGNPDKLLSETKNAIDLKVTSANSLNYMPVVIKGYTKRWDNDANHTYKGIRIENLRLSDIDNFGNVLCNKIMTDEIETNPETQNQCSWEETITSRYDLPDVERWIINRPTHIEKITFHIPEEEAVASTYTIKYDYHYYLEGHQKFPLLEYIESVPNNNTNFTTQEWYNYDDFGNKTSESIKINEDGSMVAKRISEFTYDEGNGYCARFLTSKTLKAEISANDQVTFYSYYPLSGRIKTTQNLNEIGLTEFKYDNHGNLFQTILPNGTIDEILLSSTASCEIEPPTNSVYYILSHTKLNELDVKWNKNFTFFDKYNRTIRVAKRSFNGEYIYADQSYDEMGRLFQVSEPYFSNVSPTLYTTYNYDFLGRIVKQILPTGAVIKTEYTGRTTKTMNTESGLWKETTVNVLGNPTVLNDPSNSLMNYKYDPASRICSIYSHGEHTSFEYDDAGNRTKVIDPDAGTILSSYNGLGELVSQTDARGSTFSNTYDQLGRIQTSRLTPDNTITTYDYNEKTDNGFGQLKRITKTLDGESETKIEFAYDNQGRIITKTHTFEGKNYAFKFDYSISSGTLEYYTFPSNYKIKYTYNEFGYMNNVIENATSNKLWSATGGDARGQYTDFILGNEYTTHKEFDQYGFPTRITTTKNSISRNIQDLAYSFDVITGNLSQKSEQIGIGYYLTEQYGYDPILKSRLTSWEVLHGNKPYTVQYKANGNIHAKSDVTRPTIIQTDVYGSDNDESNGTGVPVEGHYVYGNNAGIHAVTGINRPTPEYAASANNQQISYTGFNKINMITQEEKSGITSMLTIEYGADNCRSKSRLVKISEGRETPLKTKYFFDDYEIETDEVTGTSRQLHYLSAATGLFSIVEMKENTVSPYYIHTDYLGTFNIISGPDRSEKLSFDPWGRRRNPYNWSYDNVPTTFLFDRGYTGHEHLDQFGLINMNGRVFDPYLARFLSPDPILETNGNAQAFNRYSYCYNNPLKYTDPSGYKAQFDPSDPSPWNVWNPGGGPGSSWTGGGTIGPGSSHHWSDSNRSPFGTFMLGSPFNNSYGNERYNQLFNFYVTAINGIKTSINNKNSEEGKVFEYLAEGFTITPLDAFNRRIFIASLGAAGIISTSSNGGIIFENKTASEVQGSTIIFGLRQESNLIHTLNDITGLITLLISVGAESANTYVRGQFKSATSWTGWTNLRGTQQSWRFANVLGKTSANIIKITSATGGILGGLSASYSTYSIASQYLNGGLANVNGWDAADALVGWAGTASAVVLLVGSTNPVGWAVIGIGATGYGIFRAGQYIYNNF